jgi:hypothetical protein
MSIKRFESELLRLFEGGPAPDPSEQINVGAESDIDSARALNAAFLITLAGPGHPMFWEADVLFEQIIRTQEGSALGRYYQRGRSLIWRELESLQGDATQLDRAMSALAYDLQDPEEREPGAIPDGEASPPPPAPLTTAYLRTALEAVALFAGGNDEKAAAKLAQHAREDSVAGPTGSP